MELTSAEVWALIDYHIGRLPKLAALNYRNEFKQCLDRLNELIDKPKVLGEEKEKED